MRYNPGNVQRMAFALLIVALLAPQGFAVDDVGLPLYPKAILSSIVRHSGKGEGTQWVQVNFRTTASYDQVVKFYREKTGRHVHISKTDSEKVLNTLILFAKSPKDQINVNISSKIGGKVTEVEISRNFVKD